ncbi:zinc ribbon domain-containing protein [Paracidobacterium acidisoli]|uniref:Zinc ribbon domain-containing protein n=1 Tax=Paracidobacterium acidisoli TaxID=2303751 RepID=A0A372INN3_9BACT|nr:zinc ribbon domain-containing protein [Paracidobacterium acidisoli]MBT9332117.1 zinc ribbon domain-containing protein [Paracidobacterium acidisoli]
MDSTPQRAQKNTGTFSDELYLIPRWSVAGAVLAFAVMQYIFWIVLPAHRHHPGPPVGLRLYFSISWSALAALYVLMIGYISRDSPRRGMSLRLWTVVCIVMPGGIGAVLYFLLRQPIISICPACGAQVENEYHFCPQCAWQVTPCCGNCYRSTRITDLFCVHCGHDLASDHPPARLHAFTK